MTALNVGTDGRIATALAEKAGLRPASIRVTPLDRVPGAYLVDATFADGTASSYMLKNVLLHHVRARDLTLLDNQ